ncbi:abortive infection system antitoxin AbiGi family protein [Dactylosporangium sp. CA-233914]|uniref:abortive infection system antitoxin AbiGi family protein n=1 Tax=Dactylosporangium sp. CA-233914 TaxID=3239934 RepID=UPI003D8DD615
MASILDVLRERDDLSTYVIHLTKGGGDAAFDNLVSILSGRRIEARNHFGLPQSRRLAERFKGTAFARTQQAVCFTETPLKHVRHMCAEIENRSTRLRDYGVAFTRNYARRRGISPLWYVDTSPGQPGMRSHDWLTNPLRDLIDDAVRAATPEGSTEPNPARLAAQPVFRLTPFVETMGPTRDGRRKEFWWEREWRKVGPLNFVPYEVIAAVVPERDHRRLRTGLAAMPGYRGLRLVDALWTPSRIAEAMAGVEAGPFST